MNAKKIMGAVLVALLAAALFVGAGAAATVFINQDTNAAYEGTWTNGASTVIINDVGIVSASTTFVPGVYTNGSEEITILNPTMNFQLLGGSTDQYIVGTLINGNALELTVTIPKTDEDASNTLSIKKVILVQPNGNEIELTGISEGTGSSIDSDYLKVNGKYSIYAIYDAGFVTGATTAMKTTNSVEFNVAKSSAAISADKTDVTEAGLVKITIQGLPNQVYVITGLEGKFSFESTQPYAPQKVSGTPAQWYVTTSNDGTTYFFVSAGTTTGSATLKLYEATAANTAVDVAKTEAEDSIDITINGGKFTMTAAAQSVVLGDKVKITGTYTGGEIPTTAYILIEGKNYEETIAYSGITDNGDGTWEVEIQTNGGVSTGLKKMDVGTYTFTLVNNDVDKKELATVSVDLTQPFLTAEVQTPVVVQDGKLIVTGTAEATGEIGYYIFGNNKFANGTQAVEKDGTFKIELELDEDMFATGQYFLVVQHPMYNKVYNVAPALDENIYKNVSGGLTWGAAAPGTPAVMAVETALRQNANGAEALCEALDAQGIDDIYVKATFIIDTPFSNVNPIPSEVTKGTKIVVSGQTNMPEGQMVKVTMASTAFGAVPKESNNAAAFISVVTETKADGTWEVTLDTSKLNLDDYSVVAEVGDFTSSAVTVKVVEGTPVTPTETQPTQPTETQPTQTTAPETPGFGALAALAGLGAVAALLLRRE